MCCWELIILEWVIAELKRKTFWLLHCLFLLFSCYIVWVSLCICCLHSLFEDFSLWGFCFHLRAGLVCCCFLPIVLASDSCLQKENLDPSCLQVFCNSVMMQPYCAPYPWTHEELRFTIFSSELEPLFLHWFHPQPIWEWRMISTWISIATTLVTYLKRSANTKVENGNDIFSISSGMWMDIYKLQFACQLDSKGPHSSKMFFVVWWNCVLEALRLLLVAKEQHDYLCPIVCVLTYALICFQSVEIIFVPIPPVSIC